MHNNGRFKVNCITVLLLLLFVILMLHNYLRYLRFGFEDPSHPLKLVQRCTASHQKREITFKDDDIINPQFSYPINLEDACSIRNVEVVIPVHSAITNFLRRARTRKLRQGQFSRKKRNNARMIFFVGLPSDKLTDPTKFQARLLNESLEHGDIVQVNLNETYKNIAYKALAVLQWINMYCNSTEFVIKMDDDIICLLIGLYKNKNVYSEFIVGELRTNRTPEFSRDVRWRLNENEYTETTFPPFVPGPVFGYPTSTGYLLYHQALRTKILWLDDVFITGICSKLLGIPVLHDNNFGHVHRPMDTDHFIYQ